MKSSSQTRLTTNDTRQNPKDWAEAVSSDQISKILNLDLPKLTANPSHVPQVMSGSSLFQQFNDNSKSKILKNKNVQRLSSQGSSRSNVQTTNAFLNKSVNNQSLASSQQQHSPRDINTASTGASRPSQGSFTRSSTQEAQRRRSLKQQIANSNELPDLTKQRIQASFLSNKNQHQLISPTEGISQRNAGRQLKKVIGTTEGNNTDRMLQSLNKVNEDKKELNKENINDDLQSQSSYNKNNNNIPKISQSSRLPMKLQKNIISSQQNQSLQNQNPQLQSQLNESIVSHKSSSNSLNMINPIAISNPNLDKQLKEINKQKEFLLKLQREKDELEKQMYNNEKNIQSRMAKLHNERKQMEEKILQACIVIQRHARGFIARIQFKKLQEEERNNEKQKLNNILKEMETQINSCFNVVDYQIEKSAIKIQTAVRKMLARKHFRISLYKLMLLKNIVENKVHKEKMQMLYAFEQLIINTEDEDDQAYYDELYGAEDDYGEEDDIDALGGGGYYQGKQFPTMQRIPVEAEYLSNPSDIIDEEECEESEEEEEKEKNKSSCKKPQTQQQKPPQKAQIGRILTKVTANDLIEFAGQTTQSVQADDQHYEIDQNSCDMFGNNKTLNETQNSFNNGFFQNQHSQKKKNGEENNYALVPYNYKADQCTQYEPPRNYMRRAQPNQQQVKPKILALPQPEQKIQPSRPVDMERLKILSQPKLQPEFPDEVIQPKKKPSKPPVVPGQNRKKKQKNKIKLTQSDTSSNDDQSIKVKKLKKRRSSSRTSGSGISNYERLLRHRESRTALKAEKNGEVLAIEYKPREGNQQNKNLEKTAKLPQGISQKLQQQNQIKRNQNGENQKSDIIIPKPLAQLRRNDLSQSDNTLILSNVDISESLDENEKQELLKQFERPKTQNQNNRQQIQQPVHQYHKQQQQQQNPVVIPHPSDKQVLTTNSSYAFNNEQYQQQLQVQQQQQHQQQQQSDPSLLYKKCFPQNSSISFRERFPVFADILSKYNKNLKHIAASASQTKQQ